MYNYKFWRVQILGKYCGSPSASTLHTKIIHAKWASSQQFPNGNYNGWVEFNRFCARQVALNMLIMHLICTENADRSELYSECESIRDMEDVLWGIAMARRTLRGMFKSVSQASERIYGVPVAIAVMHVLYAQRTGGWPWMNMKQSKVRMAQRRSAKMVCGQPKISVIMMSLQTIEDIGCSSRGWCSASVMLIDCFLGERITCLVEDEYLATHYL